MVDPERLARILARVRRDVAAIRDVAAGHDLARDAMALSAVKYAFVTTIEGCVRAASHVVSSEGLGMPESNAGVVRALGTAGVVDVDVAVAEPVARAVGFRNILVHEYVDVDDDAVRANVALTVDLDAFVTALAAWASRA